MNKQQRKFYKEAKSNQQFKDELKEADPEGYIEPRFYSHDNIKLVFNCLYFGWKVGKGINKK